MGSEPQNGLTTDAYVVRVIDADTLEVEVRRRFAVRLLDVDQPKGHIYDSPEKNTVEGVAAIRHLRKLLQAGSGKDIPIKLFIPAGKSSINLMDINTFNRILGEVWFKGEKLTDTMIKAGHGGFRRR